MEEWDRRREELKKRKGRRWREEDEGRLSDGQLRQQSGRETLKAWCVAPKVLLHWNRIKICVCFPPKYTL